MDAARGKVGPEDPSTSTPPVPVGGVRRTTSIDTRRPTDDDPTRDVDARARDVRSTPSGLVASGTARFQARLDPLVYELVAIAATPPEPRLDDLVGATVGPGFRRRIGSVLTADTDRGSLLALLLDDLTGAQLVAGYDTVSAEDPAAWATAPERAAALLTRADLCAGWVSDGTLLEGIRATSRIPIHVGPPAPVLESDDDPDVWHEMVPLGPGRMRRRRRLDLSPASPASPAVHRYEVHFRDSHCSADGDETILHEYRVRGTVDASQRVLADLAVEALVLPYPECPNALASAGAVAGTRLDDLRRTVNRQLTGTSSCTHLNDVLRGLADLDVLLDQLA